MGAQKTCEIVGAHSALNHTINSLVCLVVTFLSTVCQCLRLEFQGCVQMVMFLIYKYLLHRLIIGV